MNADFCKRVYSTDPSIYSQRLRKIGFVNKERVLDAGSGFGQWSLALSELNKQVASLEYLEARVNVSKDIFTLLNKENIEVRQGSIENLKYDDNCFDAIFCYSVIYLTDWKKTLSEFYRVLKKGGVVYICNNGIGIALYNLLFNRNPSKDFNQRLYAFRNLVRHFSFSKIFPMASVIVFPSKMKRELARLGFENIIIDGDGQIQIDKEANSNVTQFYKHKFLGLTNVYEVIAYK